MTRSSAARKSVPQTEAEEFVAMNATARKIADHLNGEDQTVPQSVIDNLPKGATSDFLVAPPNAKVVGETKGKVTEIHPEPKSVKEQMAEHAARARADQSAARRASKTQRDSAAATKAVKAATPKRAAKPTKAKAAQVKAERVPAADVEALIAELGITKSQLGKAASVSPSLVSEWFGKGRGQLLAKSRWADVQKKAKAFAKGLK